MATRTGTAKLDCSIFELKDKVALVTGCSRGIGKALALGLSGFGAKIVATGVSDRNQDTVDEINSSGGNAIFVRCDVSKAADAKDAVEKAVQEFGYVDVLVNNAGVGGVNPAENVTEAEWDRIVGVNLRGLFFMSQAVARTMIQREKGGRIINIGSIFGRVGSEIGASPYHAAKGGVQVLTRALACEWAKYGILVNAICPGFIKTEMTASIEEAPALYKLLRDRHALGRFGEPSELVGAVVFLASDASSFITGQNLYVDGGYTAW